MGALKLIKKTVVSLAAVTMATAGCSGGPAISVLPSTDSFTQAGTEITAKMDILWVIDVSGSMQPYQSDLASNFSSFITNFVGNGYDFRMAVVTTDGHWTSGPNYDDGSFLNCGLTIPLSSRFQDGNLFDGASGYPLITSDDPTIDFSLTDEDLAGSADDIEAIFAKNINQGDCGTGQEGGLESIRAALNNPQNGTYNFPRNDAHLAVIVITDEQDYDNNAAGDPLVDSTPASEYDDFLKGVSSSDLGYSFHTIAVLPGQRGDLITPPLGVPYYECEVNGVYNGFDLFETAEEGSRYAELSDLSDGIKASLCEPFSESLQDIAQSIIETTVEFPLTDTPDSVDGVGFVVSVKGPGEADFSTVPKDSTNGWTYNAERNSIVFHGTEIPAQGSEINIFYDPDGL